MDPEEYKALRKKIGTQQEVADRLGLTRLTIQRRESGETRITEEAAIAIRSLALDLKGS